MASDAEDFADLGYAVLTWTAQGFGRSGGQIHLDSPDYEVRDAQRLIDWLAARPDIRKDGPGDPRVGVVGGSYGGGLALLLAGHDQRVDAIVPMITWNDLARSFLPESTGSPRSTASSRRTGPGSSVAASVEPPSVPGGRRSRPRSDPSCGRFAGDVCQAYLPIATTGRPTRTPSPCCASPARPACSTRSRRRRC